MAESTFNKNATTQLTARGRPWEENPGSNKWRPVIQEFRDYVTILEGAGRIGAGLLVSCDGLIITNSHVVDGLNGLLVSLHDGTRAKAVVAHRHAGTDLAIVKATIQKPSFFPLAERLAVGYDAGDEVLAIGHPRGLSFTATRGIVSEPRRTLPEGTFVQTDVAINPGNSGGPLLDSCGNLVGINTGGRPDSQGLGFAIPGQQVLDYWQEFKRLHQTGKLSIPSDERVARVEQIVSPAQLLEAGARLAGLRWERGPSRSAEMWDITTDDGRCFFAFIDGEYFSLQYPFGDLTRIHSTDSAFLLQLLRWQNETPMVRFQITDEYSLCLCFSRPFEDLDISEVARALFAMAKAVDLYAARVEDYLGA